MDPLLDAVAWARDAAEPLTWHFPLLNRAVADVAGALDLPVPGLRNVFYLVLNFALAAGLRALTTRGAPVVVRHAWCAVAGVLVTQFVMGAHWVQTLASTVVVYGLLALLPQGSAAVVAAVFAVAFGFVSVSHVYRVARPDEDYSAAQMTMTIKLTSLAFSLYDAGRQQQQQQRGDDSKIADRQRVVLEERRRLAVERTPNPLEYFGYVYFFATVITGPAISYREYVTTVDGSKMAEARKTTRRALDSVVPALRSAAFALVFLVLHVLGAAFFPLSSMWSPERTYLGEGLLARLGNMWFAMFFERAKYYFAWTMAETACIVAEFGYNGLDSRGQPRWDAINNMDIISYELSQSPRDASVRWNRVTGEWLRFCVYDRLPANSVLQMLGIYGASAFWHGFWPGYYLFFLSAGVLQLGVRTFRTLVRPRFLGDPTLKRAYDLGGLVVTQVLVSYFGAAFMCLTVERSLFLWSSVAYVGHAILVAVVALSLLAPALGIKPPRAASVDAPKANKAA